VRASVGVKNVGCTSSCPAREGGREKGEEEKSRGGYKAFVCVCVSVSMRYRRSEVGVVGVTNGNNEEGECQQGPSRAEAPQTQAKDIKKGAGLLLPLLSLHTDTRGTPTGRKGGRHTLGVGKLHSEA